MNNDLISLGTKQLKNYMDEEKANYLANYLYKYVDEGDYQDGINKLIDGIPIQYIIGNVNFYGNIFKVTPNVLIPRFETEELIEKTKKYITEYFDTTLDIVDFGTGSGCISITLKKLFPSANITAVDISDKALEIAKINALNNNVEINFLLSDLYENLNEKYDLIISNPPYLSENDEVEEIVKKNEPNIALYALNDGLEIIERIIKDAPCYLKEKGMIALEMGEHHGDAIIQLANKYLNNAKVIIEHDLQNRDRFAFIFINNK